MKGVALERLVGRCVAMESLKTHVARVARTELRVHVSGETGTGKEQVARALHELSPRSGRRFVAVNVAGFSDELFASELFGHAKGAFTGALAARDGYVAEAEGGTLFIDEVAEISPLAQVRLLRFLQEREYQRLGETATRRADVRVLSATNVDLGERVRAGRFREDLRFRLKDDLIVLPPLRERDGDVLLLARHFLRAFAVDAGVVPPTLGPDAQRLLVGYSWPGNVRQLQSEMRRLAALAPGREVQAEDLSAELQDQGDDEATGGLGLHADLRRYEARLVHRAIDRHEGVHSRAARELGITRQALHAKLRRLSPPPDPR
jgi:DNA-binding NtrC family response regulator